MKIKLLIPLLIITVLSACEAPEETADAYGNFEARELLVSAETSGKIIQLDVEEGQRLEKGQLVAIIDTTQLHLKKLQLQASIQTVSGKTQDAQPQIEVLQEQKKNLLREKKRVEALLEDKAATPKQLDDILGQIDVVEKQIAATEAQNQTFNKGLLGEIDPIRIQIAQIEDQLDKSYVHNPIGGTVLLKMAEPSEFTGAGKPLYKIANLEELELRAYVSGAQLPHVQIGETVEVYIDEDENENKQYSGTVSWISSQAEFTPKIVQTKEERVNLVYAVKIKVKNDGALKIGMPGEVIFPRLREQAMNEES